VVERGGAVYRAGRSPPDLNRLAYVDNDEFRICCRRVRVDPDAQHSPAPRSSATRLPGAATFLVDRRARVEWSGIDAVEVLLPIALHEQGVMECLRERVARESTEAPYERPGECVSMIDRRTQHDLQLRVMENYLFYEPLVRLKHVIDSGELDPSAATTSRWSLRPRRLGKCRVNLPVAVTIRLSEARESSSLTTGGTSSRRRCGCSVQFGGPGLDRFDRSDTAASRSTPHDDRLGTRETACGRLGYHPRDYMYLRSTTTRTTTAGGRKRGFAGESMHRTHACNSQFRVYPGREMLSHTHWDDDWRVAFVTRVEHGCVG